MDEPAGISDNCGFCSVGCDGFIWTLLRERGLWKQDRQKQHVAVQNPERLLFWLLFLASVGYQMYMAFAYASFDGDDAYYVVQSVLADQTGVLNRIRPYTGLSTDLDIRHAPGDAAAVDCLCGADDGHSCDHCGPYAAAADFLFR